jgi:hypothetical protein
VNLTKKETVLIIALLLGLIAGGVYRLWKKGWTPPEPVPSMQPSDSAAAPP